MPPIFNSFAIATDAHFAIPPSVRFPRSLCSLVARYSRMRKTSLRCMPGAANNRCSCAGARCRRRRRGVFMDSSSIWRLQAASRELPAAARALTTAPDETRGTCSCQIAVGGVARPPAAPGVPTLSLTYPGVCSSCCALVLVSTVTYTSVCSSCCVLVFYICL